MNQEIVGVILVGGKSSRMGSDKSLLQWNEIPFLRSYR
jgi:molybdopterin-guanine dinucleotide biosynthesis protein A